MKRLTNDQIMRKLNTLVRIANELEAEAKARYGPSGNLFYESEGDFFLMDGDDESQRNVSAAVRQSHIRFQSTKKCSLGCGAW